MYISVEGSEFDYPSSPVKEGDDQILPHQDLVQEYQDKRYVHLWLTR
jgi:hypothetical protein